MARQCATCGKSAQLGNQVTTRGKKKYLGGVGTKVTGISRLPEVNGEEGEGEELGGAGGGEAPEGSAPGGGGEPSPEG